MDHMIDAEVLDLAHDPASEFRAAVLNGLAQLQKTIPSKFFYDAEGSRLFDHICALPEYYPTRTETGILRASAGAIAAALPPQVVLVEYGSGASVKIRLLLDALDRPAAYIPIDISGGHLRASASVLAFDYPKVAVIPVCADFTRPTALPPALPEGPRVGFFPGSTIGNFHPPDAKRLLRSFHRQLGPQGRLLIGIDLKKDPAVLHAAYNDAVGVTAAFNRNLLVRAKRELAASFDLDAFEHLAFWNPAAGRVEMHLRSRIRQTVFVGGRPFRFAAGETIHTENSYKYSVDEFTALGRAAGFATVAAWTDARQLFSVLMLADEG